VDPPREERIRELVEHPLIPFFCFSNEAIPQVAGPVCIGDPPPVSGGWRAQRITQRNQSEQGDGGISDKDESVFLCPPDNAILFVYLDSQSIALSLQKLETALPDIDVFGQWHEILLGADSPG
jgi:hypothetical protein